MADARPIDYPDEQYRAFVEEDGPREGLGRVAVALRLETQRRVLFHADIAVPECNIRQDAKILFEKVRAACAAS